MEGPEIRVDKVNLHGSWSVQARATWLGESDGYPKREYGCFVPLGEDFAFAQVAALIKLAELLGSQVHRHLEELEEWRVKYWALCKKHPYSELDEPELDDSAA